MRFALLLMLPISGCAGMFGTLPPHPIVKVQNAGSVSVCRVERQADGFDTEELLRTYGNAVGGTRDSPIAPGSIREFEFPRPAKGAAPLMYTMRFWTCDGGALADKRVMAGQDATIAI
jgi:hypothetical protein